MLRTYREDSALPASPLLRMDIDTPVKRTYRARKTIVFETPGSEEMFEEMEDPFEHPESPQFSIGSDKFLDAEEVATGVSLPPEEIVDTLRRIIPFHYKRLPFLRRNLRSSFHAAFARHRARQKLPLPRSTSNNVPKVEWMYYLGTEYQWQTTQEGWCCQLCPSFSAFAFGAALLYHIHRDHPEVRAIRRRLRLEITLFPNKRGESITASTIKTSLEMEEWEDDELSAVTLSSQSLPHPASEGLPTDSFLFESEYETEQVDDTDFTSLQDLELPPALNFVSEDSNAVPKRLRVGGIQVYDRAMQEMPHNLNGVAAQERENRDEDICVDTNCSEENKAMVVIWGRWLETQRRVSSILPNQIS